MRFAVFLAGLALVMCVTMHAGRGPSEGVASVSSTGIDSASLASSGWLLHAEAASAVDDEEMAQASRLFDDEDEDEFEGVPDDDDDLLPRATNSAPSATTNADDDDDDAAPTKATPKPAQPATPSPVSSEPSVGNVIASPQSFFQPIGIWEYLGFALVVVYVVMYFVGQRANTQIAHSFAEQFKSLLEEQFAFIGHGSDDVGSEYGLVKESQYTFKMYGSGRRFCSGMLLTLDLQRRQDLLSRALALVDLAPSQDTVTLEFAMNEEDMDPFVFAVAKKKGLKKFLKLAPDVESSTTQSKTTRNGLDKYAVMSEVAELENELLPERVQRLLARPQVESHFISAHLSDQVELPFAEPKKTLRFQFLLPSTWRPEEEDGPLAAVHALTRFAFEYVDRVGQLRLSAAARTRVDARRKKLAEAAHKASARDRAEAQARRKEEQRRRERELIEKDPTSDAARELLRKREAKEAKALKKQKGGNVKLMR